jgi:putative PIN family toxin of toxin-antitoxin system
VAAFITENLCSKILLRGRKRQFHLIACPFILRGLEHVLIHKFSLRKNEVRSTLQIVSEAFHSIVRPSKPVQGICRNPNDDAIMACALGAEADYLVTGDVDLLELKSFKGIRIVTPRGFEMLFID